MTPSSSVTSVVRNTRSVEETERFAADFAQSLAPGTTLALHGEMGAGKTHFVRGIVKGLHGDPRIVSSPTYVLLNIYDSTCIKIFHLDAYRVTGPDDFDAIGFPELLEQNGLVIVEWPERVLPLLPLQRIDVTLTATGASTRTIGVNSVVQPLLKPEQEHSS
jgi:tRNA threonylcarbamoyladenosine biosynthesis protein TsaE